MPIVPMITKKLIPVGLLTAGLLLGSTSVALADTTPAPVSSSTAYQVQLASYKTALIQYQFTRVTNEINYRAAMQKYEADWKATLATYQATQTAYEAKLEPIVDARKAAFNAAAATFVAATSGTPTNAVITAALNAYWSATKAANAAYQTAVTALGAAPVRPVKPVAPVRPVDPIKPVAPKKDK